MADILEENCDVILSANEKDLEFAKKEGIAQPLIARLALNEEKVSGMAKGIRSVVALEDPVGKVKSTLWKWIKIWWLNRSLAPLV